MGIGTDAIADFPNLDEVGTIAQSHKVLSGRLPRSRLSAPS
ncbi:hypothetical protein POG22_23135 [Geitlerinema sp. CS-897]|nr:hypothetical protein [Geitlerinema sp. CS-897]